MNSSVRSGLAALGLLIGLIGLALGIHNTSQTRQITYKTVDTSYVSVSIQESSDDDPSADYLEFSDGSIFYLYVKDFPESPKLPDIYEHDVISLVYDANTKQAIDESAPSWSIGSLGQVGHIKGDGYQIVQFTIEASSNSADQAAEQVLKSYASNDYLQHPNSYYRNNWFDLTGGGLLAASIIITLACSAALYQALREEQFERRYKW